MKTLTMVVRHGLTKDVAGKDSVLKYTLITSDYQTVIMSPAEVRQVIESKQATITNLGISTAKGLPEIVATNGAIDKYTFVNMNTDQVEGTARAVILDRVEQNNKLVGYTVFTQYGTLVEMSVKDAVALANQKLVSNGKIRHTDSGDIVSSISGNYPLRQITINKAPKGETEVGLMYFGVVNGVNSPYFGAIISCTSAAEMSRIHAKLSESNANIVAGAVKVGGQEVRKALGIMRMGATKLYGVFSIDILDALIKSGAKVWSQFNSMYVSAIKYTGLDGSSEESKCKIKAGTKGEGWGLVSKPDSDDEPELSKISLDLANKICEKYTKVEVKHVSTDKKKA